MLVRLSLRSVAAAGRGILGSAEAAAPVALARRFADAPGGEGEAAAAAAEPAEPAEAEGEDAPARPLKLSGLPGAQVLVEDPDAEELAAVSELSKRTQAYYFGDPKYKHFLPRLSRKELGSYADEDVIEDFEEEVRRLGGLCAAAFICWHHSGLFYLQPFQPWGQGAAAPGALL